MNPPLELKPAICIAQVGAGHIPVSQLNQRAFGRGGRGSSLSSFAGGLGAME